MRANDSSDGLTALAVAGNHVVVLGWDMAKEAITEQRVLGFAIQRTRASDGEVAWMKGFKTFQATKPDPEPGVGVSTFHHPVQSFQWADFSVEPAATYTYRIVARCGNPDKLKNGPEVRLKVTTEPVDRGKHAVFFNRGAIASQEYARRFQNRRPDDVGQAAFDWLSRGLLEGLEAFIGQAAAGDELYGSFFEFKNTRVYDALVSARERGAKVEVLYDADSQREANEKAFSGKPIEESVKAREHSAGFAHNKFLVFRRAGKSKEVWTGSTNLSQNGIFGHSNNAHLLRDEAIAERYFEYFKLLERDVTKKPTATQNEHTSPVRIDHDIVPVFSPRLQLDALDWYAELAGAAKQALFMTFAFGMNERFVDVYQREDDVLRFALMEKKGNGQQYKAQAEDVDRIRKIPNTVVAVGHRVELNNFDRWLEETDRAVDEANVLYVHTKYMLIDPLGDAPKVIVGSANFSKASTDTNDENMLVIKDEPAVADIYLGEFMRLFSHYAFRESLGFRGANDAASAQKRKYLVPTTDWINGDGSSSDYFAPNADRALRRRYFSGAK